MRLFSFLVGLCLAAPSGAAATPAPVNGVGAPPTLELATGAVAQNRRLTVRCTGPDSCRFVLELDIVAQSATTIPRIYSGAEGDSMTIDGRPSVGEIQLAAGQSAHVRIEAERDVRPRTHDDNLFFMAADALWARHVVLSTRSNRLTTARYDAFGVAWEPFYPATVSGPLVVDAVLDARVRLTIDGHEITGSTEIAEGRAIHLSVRDQRAPPHEYVRSGGPFLALGAYFAQSETRFGMRLGYEMGITDWMIASAAIESDFARQATLSLMLEGATPNMLLFVVLGVLSVSTGIGAVLELSPTGARGAVRFVSAIQAAAVGVQITADYYPEGNEVITSVMGRLSI